MDRINKEGRYSGLLGHITEKLLKEKSVPHLGSSHLHLDIVKDVINLVPRAGRVGDYHAEVRPSGSS